MKQNLYVMYAHLCTFKIGEKAMLILEIGNGKNHFRLIEVLRIHKIMINGKITL